MEANREKLLAWDSTLAHSCAFKGLAHFLPSRKVGPLREGARRFEVSVASLPEAIKAASHERTRRSGILDEHTGETELEAVWSTQRPSVWSLVDQGSVGWPSKLRFYYQLRPRGAEQFRDAHRRVRNRELALTESGTLFAKLEFAVIFRISAWAF